MSTFDLYGWYSADQYPNRRAPVAPENLSLTTTPGELRANWTGEEWKEMAYVTPGPLPEPAPVVPHSVTMRQARLALLQAGLLATVDVVIDALPSPQKEAARIEWDYSSEVWRDKPFVIQLGVALGLDDAALDALFIAAEKL